MNAYLAFSVLAAVRMATASNGVPNYLGEVNLQPGINSGKCLTASSNANGAAVVVQSCTGASSQKWTFTGNAGAVRIFDNKCLDIVDGRDADGTHLQIWDCSDNANPNQNWYYTDDKHLAWTNHGRCVDLTDGSVSDGNPAQLWSCAAGGNQIWNTGYHLSSLPNTSEDGQSGTNSCGTNSAQDSQCQTAYINSAEDFCLWAPPTVQPIGDSERIEVAWCTKTGRGSRVIPDNTLKGVHFVKAPDYVQITGVGDFTKINIPSGDAGGELDPHGADGNGNPIGGLVYGDSFGEGLQYHEWTSFISDSEFCFRACVGANAAEWCQHIYDVMGCYWNMPANYDSGVFENCDSDDGEPMGVYGTSTWYQGVNPTPAAHAAPASSNCQSLPTVSASPARKRRNVERVARAPEPIPLNEL
ncbi:carbohydrate-binding module family 13 protein [Cylindrobasidium torrendii FP15055 ss-10]|uniref:Carbohydrate-binding module family 13 protein n=1 Tax=Cylindrobasidium torrendii FP15055 ss-10 TaxID=1314674 RepID=A0A0D7B0B2_9AGAR|nr:carbohydrate-binding module family 13 protein [Cylindrobasidium torrendii FP15055 ss-10]